MRTTLKIAFLVKLVVAILGLDLVRSKTVTSQNDAEEERWLDDFTNMQEDDVLHKMQADTPVGDNVEIDWSYQLDPIACPPPPRVRLGYSCQATTCRSDQECEEYDQKCCHNGCVNTCMPAASGPAYVDWKNTPRRPYSGRNSWLILSETEGEDDGGEVEPCSTSKIPDEDGGQDEDALLCPRGFICHIEYLGEPEKGLPNRGRCVKQKDNADSPHRKFRLKTEYHGQNVCVFERAVFADGASFVFQNHPCECHDSSITCHVGKEKKTSKRKQKKNQEKSGS